MNSRGFFWVLSEMIGLTWLTLTSHGLTWIHLDWFGFMWIARATWIPLDSLGLHQEA